MLSEKAELGDYAWLKVSALEEIGAFLDWGKPKDLFLPFGEQSHPLRLGQKVLVFIYLDKSDRPTATTRWERHLDQSEKNYKEGEAVEILIAAQTALGYKAIIQNQHLGLLYQNEIFKPLALGQKIKAYVKKFRDDGKVDLILEALGHQGRDDIAEKILQRLRAHNGFLPIDDKTSPELIYEWFGVSKKKYKMALGGLYKQRLISIHADGIRLTPA